MTRFQFLLFLPLVVLLVLGGVTLWSQEWEQVAVLVSDVSRDETELTVDFIRPVTLDRQVLIESRDESIRETYGVKHVYENHLLLKEKLRRAFLAGSRIYQ